MKKFLKGIIPLTLALSLLASCAQPAGASISSSQDTDADADVNMGVSAGVSTDAEQPVYVDEVVLCEDEELIISEFEAVALAAGPVVADTLLMPEHPGTKVLKNNKATIDYSNAADGYVMVQYTAQTDKILKVQITVPNAVNPSYATYTYNLTPQEWTTFPLPGGSGKYTINVLENTTSTKYALALGGSIEVTLNDEFGAFLRPNQYVNYENASKTIEKAKEIVGEETDPLKKVELVYNFVVNNLTYDSAKAATVASGYLPVVDEILESKTGICFDYATLMASMLRSQGVPCKLVLGWAGTAYHAWISVWTEETGWVEGAIFFDGTAWHRMDPTFASSGNSSAAILKYIGDGSNYLEKYIY